MKPTLISTLLLICYATLASASDETPTPVRTAAVVSGTASWGKAFIGSVEPARRSVVGTAVAGRINGVFAEPGDLIENGGKLAQLRLTNIQIRLASAQASLEASKQQLAELVQGPRDEELRRLEARAKGAEAVLVNARKKFDRLEGLSARGATARGDLDEALSAKAAAEQILIASKAEYEAAIAGTRKEQLAGARAMVSKAEEETNRIQDELNEHTINAPFKGYVVKRLAEKGEWVSVGDPVAEVVELNPAEIRVAVPEENVASLKTGQEVRVAVEAIASKERIRDLSGTIFRIVPDADARSRSFPVRIRVDNPSSGDQPLLKPGMLARVFLPVGKIETVLLVPQDALVLDRNRTYVFAIDQSTSPFVVTRLEVETGPTKNSMIQVKPRGRRTLTAGAQVVVEGNERLITGQAVMPL